MRMMLLGGAAMLFGCAATSAPETAAPAAEAAMPAELVTLSGHFEQGGLAFGETAPGSSVIFDGDPVMVSDDGRFLIGFSLKHGPVATLIVTAPDGNSERKELDIASRDFPVERINGLDSSKVDTYTEEQLEKIAADKQKKNDARAAPSGAAFWANGFAWPVTGRISGVFGSHRILNGVEKPPHSGIDVAAPKGTPVHAPADGVVTLADPDMYFEGGLVFIDHGQRLESALMHMSRVDVKAGATVKKGDVIGLVGATGRATGPHMHWSLKWEDSIVDPQLAAGPMPAAEPAKSGN
ncbi:MAG: M23 family metallopeptidase [Parvularculaceae bacterium]